MSVRDRILTKESCSRDYSVRYSCNTFKTSKINYIIILVQRDNLLLTVTID